jgi:uncharacterized repeat protein (TIGR03803 family)
LIHADGNFYGAAAMGGNLFGTIFTFNQTQGITVLASFGLQDGGGYPESQMIRDEQGNLYGTAWGYNGGYGNGAVYELTSAGVLKVLYEFSGGADGLAPYGGLVRDNAGNLYGTTTRGGTFGFGTVFEVTPQGAETVLYSFRGGTDGQDPLGTLLRDGEGNLYDTTALGGNSYGTVFRVSKSGAEIILHKFTQADGEEPIAGLIRDSKGNLYGTTEFGGSFSRGVIFELTKGSNETVLYNFTGGADGGDPVAALNLDKNGNLYGTNDQGGSPNCILGCGVVFKLTP